MFLHKRIYCETFAYSLKNIFPRIFPVEPNFVSSKLIHFRPFLFQKHLYLYMKKIAYNRYVR